MPIYTYKGEQSAISIGDVRLKKGVAVEVDEDLGKYPIIQHLIKNGELVVVKEPKQEQKSKKETKPDKVEQEQDLTQKQDEQVADKDQAKG